MTRTRRIAVTIAAACGAVAIARYLSLRPSNDRRWSADQAVLASAEVSGHTARVHNIRFASYRSASDYTVAYYDRAFDLDSIRTAWFIVEPFSGVRGPAHTFVSFGFADGSFLAISAEIRKERGETFSPLKGLLRQYELMYVVGDERDLIALRTNVRHDSVYLYPVRATPAQVREMFVGMLDRANRLRAAPEFYNTLTNTCTTNIVRHVNRVAPKRVPFSYKVLLPGYSDRLAYDLGLIDTPLPFDQARVRYRINERAQRYADSANFSLRIREP